MLGSANYTFGQGEQPGPGEAEAAEPAAAEPVEPAEPEPVDSDTDQEGDDSLDTSDDDLEERPSRSSVIPAGFTVSDALRPREEDLHDLVGKSVVIHKSSGWVWVA